MNFKCIFAIATGASLIVSCGDSDSKFGVSGIGSVELNDSVFAIHYYKNTLRLSDAVSADGLRDSCRVFFSGTGSLVSEGEDGAVYDFTPSVISANITTPVFLLDSVAQASADTMRMAGSPEGFFAHDIHITRDWRRNDFLDATGTYPGALDASGDYFGFFADTSTIGTDTVRLWLRLCRARTDSALMVVRRISAPVNCLRDSARERIVVNISRIDAFGDTVSSDLVYSYVNWIE